MLLLSHFVDTYTVLQCTSKTLWLLGKTYSFGKLLGIRHCHISVIFFLQKIALWIFEEGIKCIMRDVLPSTRLDPVPFLTQILPTFMFFLFQGLSSTVSNMWSLIVPIPYWWPAPWHVFTSTKFIYMKDFTVACQFKGAYYHLKLNQLQILFQF